VKLRQLSLSYRLSDAIARRLSLEGATVYVTGRNLYGWYGSISGDPEQDLSQRHECRANSSSGNSASRKPGHSSSAFARCSDSRYLARGFSCDLSTARHGFSRCCSPSGWAPCQKTIRREQEPQCPGVGDDRHSSADAGSELHPFDVLRPDRAVGSEWTQQWAFNARDARTHRSRTTSCSTRTPRRPGTIFYSRPGYASFTLARDASADPDIYYRGIAKLFNAWTFQIITDLWDPAPYTDAFKPEIREPKYDSQQFIYNGIFANLDTAITL